MLATTSRYVTAMALLGVSLAVLAVATLGLARPDPWPLLAMTVLVALGERTQLEFRFERAAASFTLIEVAITASLLLLPPGEAILATAAGSTLTLVARRLGAIRVVFNAGLTIAGVSLAALVARIAPTVGPEVADRPVLGVILGMGAYVAINLQAMVGLFHRLGGPEASRDIRAEIPLTAAMLIGQVATGIVLAAVVTLDPALAPLVVAPAAAVYLAGRGARRSSQLLARVRGERDRLTRIVDAASDGILLIDGEGRVQVWSPAMERLTGLAADAVRGEPIAAVLGADRRDAGQDPEWLPARGLDAGAGREADATWTHVDGSVRAVRESHAWVFDERGRCTGDVVIVRDVSRQQELDRLRSDFVARVSHELRTPLTPIRGFASVLLRRGDALSDDQRREALGSILDSAGHLQTLVEDLLLVTQIERGDIEALASLRSVAVGALVDAAVESIGEREPSRLVAVEGARTNARVQADPARVAQILAALLDNAVRYSPAGAPIEVVVLEEPDRIAVRVTDHGPGIPRDRHDLVFERFQRLEDPLTMRTGGVGLGLFLSRSLASAMRGRLELDPPRRDQGASFVLWLPRAES